MDKLKFSYKFDMYLFIISIFLQCFAMIKTNKFGISFSTLVVVYLSIRYKLFIREKYNIKFIIFNFILIVFIMLSFLINQLNIDYLKVLRLEMVIFIIYFSIRYIKFINDIKSINYFINVIKKVTVLICIYGIYEYIACVYRLPLFLNIFKNNTSYANGPQEFYFIGSGWVKNRICTTFNEPSFYAIFLDVLYFIINFNSTFKKNKITNILLILNLILTFSRSGQMIYIYILIFYSIFCLLIRFKVLTRSIYLISIIIPIINIYILDFVNTKIFNDFSSKGRTNSVLYYLKGSIENGINCLFGHGYGIIQKNYNSWMFKYNKIESFAHNGYVEIWYEVGLVTLLFLILFILNMIVKNILNKKNRFLLFLIIININDFGTDYSVESISIIIAILAGLMLVDSINVKTRNQSISIAN